MLLAEDSQPLYVSFVFCLLLLKNSGQRVQHIHCCLLFPLCSYLSKIMLSSVLGAWWGHVGTQCLALTALQYV